MKQLITIAALLLTLGASAQTGRWDISLSGGPAIPTGNFGKKDIGQSKSEYALTGWDVQALATYRVYRGLGATVLAGHQNNPFDNKAGDVPTPYSPFTSWRIMGGLSYRLPLGPVKKWALTTRFLAGVERPSLDLNAHYPTPFTWEGGLGAQYALARHWYLLATADFVSAKYTEGGFLATPSGVYSVTVHEPRTSLNTNLGVGFSI